MCHHQHGRWQKFILHVAHAHPTYTVISFSQVLIAAATCNNLHLDLQRRDSIPHPFSTQGCPNPSLFLADTPATLMTPIFSCRWELRHQGHVLERSRCFAGDLVSGVEVMSFPVPCFWSVLSHWVCSQHWGNVVFFHPTAQNPLAGPKTIVCGMVFSHCSKGRIQESQKLVTIQPWTESISQASTSYPVLSSWVKLSTGVSGSACTSDSVGWCRTCLQAEIKL